MVHFDKAFLSRFGLGGAQAAEGHVNISKRVRIQVVEVDKTLLNLINK
jgi:hypothetical protein